MKLGKVLIEPSYNKPSSYHGPSPNESEGNFDCSRCNESIFFNLAQFSNQGWGTGNDIPEKLHTDLNAIFDAPIVGKSHDGGSPSYQLVTCSNCSSKYIIYCGVDETSNSVWRITIQGVVECDA